jgi:hypothetical protein
MRHAGGEVERVDEALAALARGEAALRLRLGQALEVVSRSAAFELGFSSPAAYVLERCQRGVRWAEVARCLARRFETLPVLRHAVAVGQVSWSMAELLARVARPEDEARWVEMAESRTVRQMRVQVAVALACQREAGGAWWQAFCAVSEGAVSEGAVSEGAVSEGAVSEGAVSEGEVSEEGGDASREGSSACDDMCTLTRTVAEEDAWLFEATLVLLAQLGVRGADEQMEALLAEAQGTLSSLVPEGMLDLGAAQHPDPARRRWLAELGRWRVEAEALCELHQCGWQLAGGRGAGAASHGDIVREAANGMVSLEQLSHAALDGYVCALAERMARHELELARLVLQFHRADGWRRLGYASETQYARERLGLSRSSVLARRLLAQRLENLPLVAAALGAGRLGVEAALQVVRVATVKTEAAWVARAQVRTMKHLREEVVAALAAVRWSGQLDCPPPVDAELVAFQALEQAVVSGRLSPAQARCGEQGGSARPRAAALQDPESEERRAWLVMLASLAAWLESALQMSAAGASASSGRSQAAKAGRVALRLRMSRATSEWWVGLEARARRWLPRGMSWLRFVCLSLWHAWQHLLGAEVAYGHIYIRDRYRCMSPVCNRRDVTPHHLVFRSAGGGDEDTNVGSICTWCHLHGVHGGRIRATGTAGLVHWELGAPSAPCLVVHGRERMAA